jgi:hypothetical protein
MSAPIDELLLVLLAVTAVATGYIPHLSALRACYVSARNRARLSRELR